MSHHVLRRRATVKILHALPYLQPAGTERHVLALSDAQMAQGCDVRLLSPDGPLRDRFAAIGVKHTMFPAFKGIPAPALRGIAAGVSEAIEWGADVIHVHAGVEVLWGVRRALKRAQKHTLKPILKHTPGARSRPITVFTVHSYFGKLPQFDYYLAAKLTRRWADRVIAVSEADAKTLEGHGLPRGRKLVVVHNGMPDHGPIPEREARDLRRSLIEGYGAAPDAALCLVVGRLAAQKGIDVLLDALARYQGPPVLVAIAGDGELRGELEAQASRLGLLREGDGSDGPENPTKHRVAFLGARNDVPHLLAAADLFVLPSRMEGLSLALVEAHAAGLPCLATDVGGNGEILAWGSTGLLVPSEQPQALASELQKLLSDKERLQAMGEAAKARYEAQFTVEKMTAETLAIYRSAIEELRR